MSAEKYDICSNYDEPGSLTIQRYQTSNYYLVSQKTRNYASNSFHPYIAQNFIIILKCFLKKWKTALCPSFPGFWSWSWICHWSSLMAYSYALSQAITMFDQDLTPFRLLFRSSTLETLGHDGLLHGARRDVHGNRPVATWNRTAERTIRLRVTLL